MRYSIASKNKYLLYLIIIFAMLSAVLRISSGGMSSLYRLTAPLVAIVILFNSYKSYGKDLVIFALVMLYSSAVSLVFYRNIEVDFIGFAGYLLFLWVIIRRIRARDKNFNKNFFSFLNICTIVTVILAWLQLFTGYSLPYTSNMSEHTASVFFYNENDFSAAVGCMFIVYSFLILIRKEWKYLPLALSILYFAYTNDAKLSLIGDVVALMVLLLFMLRINIKKSHGEKTFIRALLVISILLAVILYAFNISISFRDYIISIRKLLFEPVKNILTGTMIKGGSIQDRTNAIICGFMELIKTKGFGIGFGNSVVMMMKPEYRPYFYNAESMHNLFAEMITEFGYVAMVIFFIIVKRILNSFGKGRNDYHFLKSAFFVGFIFISAQSSVSIFSNYFLWSVAIYIILLSDDKKSRAILKLSEDTGL